MMGRYHEKPFMNSARLDITRNILVQFSEQLRLLLENNTLNNK